MSYQLEYNYTAGDIVWIVNEHEQSVHKGICTQVDIKIYKDSALGTPPPNTTHILYWVMLDGEVGSVKVLPEDIFNTIEDALTALGVDIQASPTPTNTPTVTPTNTPTPSVTPTVTPTPSVTPSS